MPGARDRTHARRNFVFAGLHAPRGTAGEFVGKHGDILARLRCRQFVAVHVDLAAGQVAESAGMVPVQVPQEHEIDVGDRQTQSREIAGNSLFRGHFGWIHQRSLGVEPLRPQFAGRELAVVAADVVKEAPVRRLDQIGQDRRPHVDAVAAITRRHELLVALSRGQQRPDSQRT